MSMTTLVSSPDKDFMAVYKETQPSSHVTTKLCASVAMHFQWSRLQSSLIFPTYREMSRLAYGAIGIKEAYNTRNFTTWKQLQMHIYTFS